MIWVALALAAGIGGAAVATASSQAGDDPPGASGDLQITAATDPSLTSTDPTDGDAAARLSQAAGVAGITTTPQAWEVGGQSVIGYTAADGRFCFAFRGLTGGCLQSGVLSDASPLDISTDHGPATFRVYGLALDGVTAITIHVGTVQQAAALAHNAFLFSDDALGATGEAMGEAIATMADGTTRTQTFPITSLEAP